MAMTRWEVFACDHHISLQQQPLVQGELVVYPYSLSEIEWKLRMEDSMECICVAKINLQCNMQNGNAICKMVIYFYI